MQDDEKEIFRKNDSGLEVLKMLMVNQLNGGTLNSVVFGKTLNNMMIELGFKWHKGAWLPVSDDAWRLF